MSYLIDTNVLSEVRRPRPDPQVLAWLDRVEEDRVFLSVITIAELARGIALLPEGQRKAGLAEWLDGDLRLRFGERLLAVDETSAVIWGRLMADSQRQGRNLAVMDGWIGATALRHGLVVVTRNVKDFMGLGVELLDPWTFEN